MSQTITVGQFTFGPDAKPMLIAGPCVIESEPLALSIAESIAATPVGVHEGRVMRSTARARSDVPWVRRRSQGLRQIPFGPGQDRTTS